MARRILCFGDSLTEGYTFQSSGKFHPYSINLSKILQDHGLGEIVVETAGVSGERVVASMTHRLDMLLKKAKHPYDWVIILGGTNDLGEGKKSDELLPHIFSMHNRAKETGSKTLALALPQFRHELTLDCEKYKNEKAKINEGIKQYCEKSASTTFFVDLWTHLPFGTLSREEINLYWVDGLHMTPLGYDKMASVIFDTLNVHM